MTKRYQAPIVKKAFDILRAITKSKNGLRITDLASRLDISKSTVHGIISALEDQGAIVKNSTSKRWMPGPTLIELGRITHEQIDLKKIARPILENLMEACGESVFIGLRNNDTVTVIDIVESKKDFKITSPIGTSIPLLAGAIGKVFLSLLPENEAEHYLETAGLNRFTERSINSINAYLETLARVREQGYATDDEEYIPGVRAVAVPIQGYREYSAAIWVVGFKASITTQKMKILIKQTREAALAISRNLPN